jgi:hypothetical protein
MIFENKDIDKPLTVYGGKKFHMRVHVLASGTLQVYVHQDIIALISTETYVREEIDNRFMRIFIPLPPLPPLFPSYVFTHVKKKILKK